VEKFALVVNEIRVDKESMEMWDNSSSSLLSGKVEAEAHETVKVLDGEVECALVMVECQKKLMLEVVGMSELLLAIGEEHAPFSIEVCSQPPHLLGLARFP
jgi:hypothetical protein